MFFNQFKFGGSVSYKNDPLYKTLDNNGKKQFEKHYKILKAKDPSLSEEDLCDIVAGRKSYKGKYLNDDGEWVKPQK